MNTSGLTKGKLKESTKGRKSARGRASPPPSVPPTTPYAIFKCSIGRSENLLTIHKLAHGAANRPPILLMDIHRASIVLAVSALDAYIRTLVVNRVQKRLKDITKPIPKKLRDELKNLLDQNELLDAAREGDLSSRVQKALTKKFEESSFQGVSRITQAIKLIGIEDIFRDIARSASMNEQQLKEGLGRFTKRRHLIAHCGDYDLTQTPPCEISIVMKDAKDCISLVKKIAAEIDKVVSK